MKKHDAPFDYVLSKIGPNTKYIISTSERLSSMERYQKLLQEVLHVDIAYITINPYPNETGIDPEKFASAIRGLGAIGGAISKDIKSKIIPFLDDIDESAKKVMAVNTVIREDNKLIGYNTDAFGFEKAIKKGLKESGIKIKSALVYGYGGVFNVVFHVLSSLGIELSVTGRRNEAVNERVKDFKLKPYDGKPKDLFVNAAPVSDMPLDKTVGFLEAIRGCLSVFDHHMPGNSLRKYCEKNEVFYIPGTEMYYPQMYRQWELFLKGIARREEIPELISMAEKLCENNNT